MLKKDVFILITESLLKIFCYFDKTKCYLILDIQKINYEKVRIIQLTNSNIIEFIFDHQFYLFKKCIFFHQKTYLTVLFKLIVKLIR